MPGNGAATLLWDPVPGALSYQVTWRSLPSGSPTVRFASGASYTFDQLSNGTTWGLTVTARTPFGLTAASSVSVTPTPTLPEEPTGVNVIASGRTRVLLNWSVVASATGYNVLRATTPGGPYTQIASALETTTYLDTGLTPDTRAYYVVQAEGTAGSLRGAYSDEIGAPLDGTVAPAPGNLTATPGHQWARLDWTAVPQATGYVVFAAHTPTATPSRQAWVTVGQRFDSLSLTNGDESRFFVGAARDGKLGDLAEVRATPLVSLVPRPLTLALSSVYLGTVSFSVTGASANATHTVLRSTQRGGPYTAVGTSTNDTTAQPGLTYFWVVRPQNGSVQGDLSNEVSVTTPLATTPAVPAGLVAQPGNSAVQLAWDPVAGAERYQVGVSLTPDNFNVACSPLDGFDTRCSATATNATPTYFAVRAGSGSNFSAWSTPVQVVPSSTGLARPSVQISGGNGALTLGWSPV
ncbi:MAG TPA: fibronectin type III domain-containing protein, partial [Archangium sp.]